MANILQSLPRGSYAVEERDSGPVLQSLPTGNYSVETPSRLSQLPAGSYSVEAQPETLPDFSNEEYAPSDLLEGEKFDIVNRFLTSRFGIDEIDGYTNQEKVDKFLNTMRYFDAGNTVQTVAEVDHILSGDEDTRRIYGEAINLFQGLGGITSEAYTWGETLDAVGDYAWGVIVDPVNLIAPIYGKVFAASGTRGLTKFAQHMATKEVARQVARGAAPRVAQAAANRVRGEAIRRYRNQFGRQLAVREAVGAGMVSTAASVGTDLAYQHGLIQTGNQEEISALQTGIAALGGLVGVGADVGFQSLRGVSRLPTNVTPANMSVNKASDLTGVLGGLAEEVRKAPRDRMKRYFEGFADKVARGEELPLKDSDFFIDLIMGNDDLGFKGLAPILQEKGFMWRGARHTDDNFSNWLGDAMRNAPEDEVMDFLKAFEDVSGITVTDLAKASGGPVKNRGRKAITILADNMAAKVSNAGRVFNAVSRASKMLGGLSYKKVTADDYAKALFDQAVGEVEDAATESVVGQGIRYAQNTYIRMLVTHPGTSALNVAGWATKSAGQSISDMLRGTVIYGGDGILKKLGFKAGNAAEDWARLTGVYKANIRKVSNLLDPNTTAESFESLMRTMPERYRDLTGVLPGGVTKSIARDLGLDEAMPLWQQKTDRVVDFLQQVSFVKAQDVFTKSQEFMYNMDVVLREGLSIDGKRLTLRELLQRDDLNVIMQGSDFKRLEMQAIDRTLENIMSKSYAAPFGKQGNMLQEVARVVEEARNIPLVGLQVPFGRFFNNVVATTSEYSGVTALLKPFVRGVGDSKSYSELLAKAAVGWTSAGLLVNREEELLQRGIAFNEDIDETTGQRVDVSYDSPFIGVKAAARIIAHRRLDQEVPPELLQEARKLLFGQLTRQLTGTTKELVDTFDMLLAGEIGDAANAVFDMVKSSGTLAVSGTTRFLEPLNVMVSLGSDPENYVVKDFNAAGGEIYKGLRYVDAILGEFINSELPKAERPLESQVSREGGRLFGYRQQGPITAGSRVFAMIGRPDWDAGIKADSEEAKNFFTSVFQPVFEGYAQKLIESESFRNANLEGKTLLVREALENARRSVHGLLADSPNLNSNKMQLLFKLTSNRTVRDLEDYMQELGIEAETPMDLDMEELRMLDFFISDEDERIKRGVYQ